jgi:osmoprotectant transport system permease protein
MSLLEYAAKYYDRLLKVLLEHIELVLITLALSLLLAGLLTVIGMFYRPAGKALTQVFSAIYSIPSLALFAIMMPVTGLGRTTAVIVLVFYNQYILLRNFLAGLNEVDPAVVESAIGMGMSRSQVLYKVRLPIAKRALFVGVRLAVVSTIAIATIAAYINAGGIGRLLLEGIVSSNTNKIIWGSILSAGLAIATNAGLVFVEKKLR